MLERVLGDSHHDQEPDSDDSLQIPIRDNEDEDMMMEGPDPVS